MITQLGIHDPQRAAVSRFQSEGRKHASITFDDDHSFKVYTSPEMAERIKWAVNGPTLPDYEMTGELEPHNGLLDYVNYGFSTDSEFVEAWADTGPSKSYTDVRCTLLWAEVGGTKIPRYMLCEMVGEARIIALENDASERATEYENAA